MSGIGAVDLIVMDPPFDIWEDIATKWGNVTLPDAKTVVAFTNWQNRVHVAHILGEPRINMIWHFPDGRWVSNKMPRLTHEDILIYGETGSAACGDDNPLAGRPVKKGKSSIGRWSGGDRVYTPGQRKFLNSVQTFPRNVSGALGVWGKPVELMRRVVEFCDAKTVFDPFMGSGSVGVACHQLGADYIGCEIRAEVFDGAAERIKKTQMPQKAEAAWPKQSPTL
jgi:hypothetical protein